MIAEMTIVATFDDKQTADRALSALRDKGFADHPMEVLQAGAEEVRRNLAARGFGEEDAGFFAAAAGEGQVLVCASIPENVAERATAILESLDDLEADMDAEADGESDLEIQAEATAPIVEERVSVGKSRIATGGARIRTKVQERPVEETVTLREEQVEAEQRTADRPLAPGEVEGAFEAKTIEMMGVREEAEVVKEARVVGEVALTRTVETREETVHDTARHTEVDIEEVEAGNGKRDRD